MDMDKFVDLARSDPYVIIKWPNPICHIRCLRMWQDPTHCYANVQFTGVCPYT